MTSLVAQTYLRFVIIVLLSTHVYVAHKYNLFLLLLTKQRQLFYFIYISGYCTSTTQLSSLHFVLLCYYMKDNREHEIIFKKSFI